MSLIQSTKLKTAIAATALLGTSAQAHLIQEADTTTKSNSSSAFLQSAKRPNVNDSHLLQSASKRPTLSDKKTLPPVPDTANSKRCPLLNSGIRQRANSSDDDDNETLPQAPVSADDYDGKDNTIHDEWQLQMNKLPEKMEALSLKNHDDDVESKNYQSKGAEPKETTVPDKKRGITSSTADRPFKQVISPRTYVKRQKLSAVQPPDHPDQTENLPAANYAENEYLFTTTTLSGDPQEHEGKLTIRKLRWILSEQGKHAITLLYNKEVITDDADLMRTKRDDNGRILLTFCRSPGILYDF